MTQKQPSQGHSSHSRGFGVSCSRCPLGTLHRLSQEGSSGQSFDQSSLHILLSGVKDHVHKSSIASCTNSATPGILEPSSVVPHSSQLKSIDQPRLSKNKDRNWWGHEKSNSWQVMWGSVKVHLSRSNNLLGGQSLNSSANLKSRWFDPEILWRRFCISGSCGTFRAVMNWLGSPFQQRTWTRNYDNKSGVYKPIMTLFAQHWSGSPFPL